MCKNLTNLDLKNNIITNTVNYRQKVKATIPSILILDGFGFDAFEPNTNITDCSSSLTSDLSKDSSSISDRILEGSRPTSGINQFDVIVNSKGRASTSGISRLGWHELQFE